MADTNCNHSIPDPSCEVCGLHQLARNHYFDGKFMATRQFQVEQDYVRGANQRQNAYMHGVGTVCGLKIAEHDNPDCRNQYVVLNEGLAIDCCGREIVVPANKVLDIRARVQEKLAAMGANPPDLTTADREAYTLRILLEYRQRGAEPVPALLDDCDDGSGEECDQIVESFAWDVTLDRESPPSEGDPLEPSLEWRQTLTVARPAAAVVDRDSERLYVAEMGADGGAVRVYNTETHDLLAYALVHNVASQVISAVALSRNGETLIVAVGPGDDGQLGRIILVNRADLEAMALPDPAAAPLPYIELVAGQRVVGLAAAVRDDALLALVANEAPEPTATLRRWSADEIAAFLADPANQPVGADRNLTALLRAAKGDPQPPLADIRPVDMVQDIDGRWLIVADAADTGAGAGRLVAISLAGFNAAETSQQNFINAFGLGAGRAPRSVDLSYDGGYAYVVVSDDAVPPAVPATSLLRLKTDPTDLGAYLPDSSLPLNDRVREAPLVLAGEEGGPDAIDAVVTPRDTFAYVLRRAGGSGFGGDLLIVDVEQVEQMGPGIIGDRAAWLAWLDDPDNQELLERALRAGPVVQGAVDFQALAPLGQSLYVATHREPPPPGEGEEPQQVFDGRVRVYDIDEASCDAGLRAIIEACPTCGTTQPLVLATISRYWYDQPMVENELPGDEPYNLIDNFSERPLAPSNVVLREVIECLIAKGIAEGIPGPRGPQGEQGLPGNDGIGLPGDRGPGVVRVAQPVLVGAPDAFLQEIPNDPLGDFELVLTLPDVGGVAPANHVIGANFLHKEIFNRDQFVQRFINTNGQEILHGILIGFEQAVVATTLSNRTVYATIHLRAGRELEVSPISLLPLTILPVIFDPAEEGVIAVILNGYRIDVLESSVFRLEVPPQNVVFERNDVANGVLLVSGESGDGSLEDLYGNIINLAEAEIFPRQFLPFDPEPPDPPDPVPFPEFPELPSLCQVTITIRGDQVMTPDGLFLDGNNMSGKPGMGLPSGNGTPGGDWVAVMHLVRSELG